VLETGCQDLEALDPNGTGIFSKTIRERAS